jgi:hypothetical protein
MPVSKADVQTTIQSYLHQWMKTAGLDVNIQFAWHADRMRVGCKQCHTVEILPVPIDSDKIDWTLQDYVRRHKPGGPHNIDETQLDLIAARKALVNPVPVTADFKRTAKITQGRRFR